MEAGTRKIAVASALASGTIFVSLLALLGARATSDGSAKARTVKIAPSKVPTYARDVAAVIQTNCSGCHRPGEVAPFSLLSYDDARKRAKQIAAVAKTRFMPPWKADSHGEF